MYLSIVSTIFGILFILTGIAGFVPAFSADGLLFNTFAIDKIHSIFNIVVGVIALLCSMKYKADRWFFQVFGVIFGIIAILGFVLDGNLVITQINMADNVLDFVITVVFLVLGFSSAKEGRV